MFTTRLVSGIILVLIAIAVVGAGGVPLFAVTFFLSMVGLFELYRVMKIEKTLLGYMGYATVISYYILLWAGREIFMMLMFIAFLMILMAIYVFSFPKYQLDQVSAAFFGIFYVAVMMSYLYQVRITPDGKYIVWLIFLSSWGCDTSAYCVGTLAGKHKLAPLLSPKKSIEGAVGGVAGSVLLGLLYGAVFGGFMVGVESPVAVCSLACGIGAVISQIGDLAASAIKRNHHVKDYGKLIPGHGGILDRFDSLLFTAPAIYFAVEFLH